MRISNYCRHVAAFSVAALLSSNGQSAADETQQARIAKIMRDQDFEHLKPETPFLGFSFPDGEHLRRDYPEAFDIGVSLRAFASLSFCCNVMTTMERQNGAYRIVSMTRPYMSSTVKASRCETTIPAGLGDHIVVVWQGVLRHTRYGKEPMGGADGASYLFASAFMTGWIWTPPPTTIPGKLVALSNEIQSVCAAGKKADVGKLESMTGALEGELAHYQ